MTKPKIEIRYIEGCDMDEPDHGYIRVSVNGNLIEDIYTDFTTGNNARLHLGLCNAVEKAYEIGVKNGVQRSKERISDLIDWAKSIDDE
jgi:hypothetical protein